MQHRSPFNPNSDPHRENTHANIVFGFGFAFSLAWSTAAANAATAGSADCLLLITSACGIKAVGVFDFHNSDQMALTQQRHNPGIPYCSHDPFKAKAKVGGLFKLDPEVPPKHILGRR